MNSDQLKFLAAWLDRASTSFLTVGVLAPLATRMFVGLPNVSLARLVGGTIALFLISLALHAVAQLIIRRTNR